MKDIQTAHSKSMELCEKALDLKRNGRFEEASRYFREAFEHERFAAYEFAKVNTKEPARSVLFRSAATLALDAGEYAEAERLIAMGLSVGPPDEIADELRDLLEQVYFKRHLDLKGVDLDPNEIQFSISGKAVGYGVTLIHEFIDRVQDITKLIYRTAERIQHRPFREKGSLKKNIREDFGLCMTVPKPGSFVATFLIGYPKKEKKLPELDDTVFIICELFDCLELFIEEKEEDLKAKIVDPAYYQNFIALTKKISPDGENVNQVGFVTHHKGVFRKVALTKKRSQISLLEKAEPSEEIVEVIGRLKLADSRKEKGRISIVEEESGLEHKVIVRPGMMSDIVRPLWEEKVVVRGVKSKKDEIILEDIEIYEER